MECVKREKVMFCPITEREEIVSFSLIQKGDAWQAAFNGCNGQFSKCEECDICCKEAFRKLEAGEA